MEAKLQVLLKSAMELVRPCKTDAWESMKESCCSKLVVELGSFKQQAEDSADTIIFDASKKWSDGLNNIKKFVKMWRDYGKVTAVLAKHAKLLDVAPLIQLVCVFLHSAALNLIS